MALQQKYLSSSVLAITAFSALLLYDPSQGLALPLGAELASFAVLGGSTVTNTGATTLTGNLGVSPGSAISGFFGTVENDGPGTFSGASYQAVAFAGLAHDQLGLGSAGELQSLGLLGAGTLLSADLVGLVLNPGIYTVAAGPTNLSGTLTLDGQGNANALWVFQMPSTLITSPGSVVSVINTGSGAGLFWNVGSSATIDTTTSFQGNILALTDISLNTGATIGCGRALAYNGQVSLQANTVGTACTQAISEGGGSNGFSGSVPEPSTWLLLGSGLAGLAAWRRKQAA